MPTRLQESQAGQDPQSFHFHMVGLPTKTQMLAPSTCAIQQVSHHGFVQTWHCPLQHPRSLQTQYNFHQVGRPIEIHKAFCIM